MSRASEMMIAESNRNEGKAALEKLNSLKMSLATDKTLDELKQGVWIGKIIAAERLIVQFIAKHQPDVQRYK